MTRRTSAAACLVALLASVAAAEAIRVPALPAESTAPPPPGEAPLELDLLGAFELALARNLDLQVGRYDLALADTGILGQSGIFDPTFTAGVDGSYRESPSATQLEGALVSQSRRTGFNLGLGQLLPTGTQLGLDLSSDRSATNSQFYYLNPNWSSGLTASLTQPLLSGFGTLVNRAGIVVAQNSREQTASAFATVVIATLAEVERAYWGLEAAREQVKVAEQSVQLAERLLEETRQRVKVGTSAPIDLVQSEAGVATRRQELIYARNAAGNAEDALKAQLGFDRPEEWLRPIVTTEAYEMVPQPTDLEPAIRTALEKRPDLERQELSLETLDLNAKLARNQVLPQLDLKASYGFAGTGGKGEIELPNGDTIPIDSGWTDSMEQIRDADYPGWTLGLSLSLPIGNNQAQATLAQRRWELEQGKARLQLLRQQVIREVRQAVRALDDGAAAIEAAVASRQLAERNLQAEHTKFNNGLSTNYQVLQIQQDLSDAQLAELRARIDYRKAMAGYRLSTGTFLEAFNVEIVDPGAPPPHHDYWQDVEWLQFVDLEDPFGARPAPETAPAP